jgi:hypothetical protein
MNKLLIYVFIIAIVIIFLIIIISMVRSANNCCIKYQNYLTGMWIGDPEFLKNAELSDLQIFISPNENKKRNGYIIMLDNNKEFILNQPIELEEYSSKHNQRWSAHSANKKNANDLFHINFILHTKINDIFPKQLIFALSITNGALSISDHNGKIYSLLEKDLISSSAAVNIYKND